MLFNKENISLLVFSVSFEAVRVLSTGKSSGQMSLWLLVLLLNGCEVNDVCEGTV